MQRGIDSPPISYSQFKWDCLTSNGVPYNVVLIPKNLFLKNMYYMHKYYKNVIEQPCDMGDASTCCETTNNEFKIR